MVPKLPLLLGSTASNNNSVRVRDASYGRATTRQADAYLITYNHGYGRERGAGGAGGGQARERRPCPLSRPESRHKRRLSTSAHGCTHGGDPAPTDGSGRVLGVAGLCPTRMILALTQRGRPAVPASRGPSVAACSHARRGRLYESREVAALEVRAPPMDVLAPAVKVASAGVTPPPPPAWWTAWAARACARRTSGGHPHQAVRRVRRPPRRRHLPVLAPHPRPARHVPAARARPPALRRPRGAAAAERRDRAPPHREAPVKPVGGSRGRRGRRGRGREEEREEETWRDPQRPGSPGCYARASLRPGLALERRVLPPPQDSSVDSDSDVGVVGVTQVPGRQVEVVVARAPITRYTQLGPVVGAPVRERDIPDDFCMVNLWEVFSGEGKRYLSTVDPRRSNWTRYLRPAPDRDSANLVVVPRPMLEPGEETSGVGGNVGGVGVFLITTQDVSVGQELMFWAHDPTLAWSRKKMEKTSKCFIKIPYDARVSRRGRTHGACGSAWLLRRQGKACPVTGYPSIYARQTTWHRIVHHPAMHSPATAHIGGKLARPPTPVATNLRIGRAAR
nr:uncharacterized protein LOC113829420 [Penaeus vannamei]